MQEKPSRRAALTTAARPSLEKLRDSSMAAYGIIVALFLLSMYADRYSYTAAASEAAQSVQLGLNTGLLAFTALHVFYTLTLMILAQPGWRRRSAAALLAAPVVLFLGFVFVWRGNLERNRFHAVLALFVALLAYGKDYRRILQIYLTAYCLVLLGAALGLALGYTYDNTKFSTYGVKYSFGMVHPNTTGHIVMLIVMLVWFLWLQKKRLATFTLFWGVAIPLAIFVRCRTAVALMAVFPLLCLWAERRGERAFRSGWGRRALILAPWLFLALTLLLCSQMEPLHRTYGTFLRNSAERFVQGGIALKTHGMPILGCDIDTSGSIRLLLNGRNVPLYVMDNAYISYGIILGSLWLAATLSWLSLANRKAIRERDWALVCVCLAMLVFAMMERRGLDVGYNIALLYPLASARRGEASGHV